MDHPMKAGEAGPSGDPHVVSQGWSALALRSAAILKYRPEVIGATGMRETCGSQEGPVWWVPQRDFGGGLLGHLSDVAI